MQVTVFGASGKIGRIVVEMLLERGDSVIAFVHHQPHFDEHSKLKIVQGDIHDSADIGSALANSDAVISTLGSWGTPSKDILSSAMRKLIPAMDKKAVKRIITLTGADARASGDQLGLVHRASHALMSVGAGKVLSDAEKHIALLEASKLDWTVIRSPVMNNVGSKEYKLIEIRPLPFATINRTAVAQCLVDQLKDTAYSRQAPYIIRNS